MLWKARLHDEILDIYALYFQNPDTRKQHKAVTKPAINSTVNFLRTIPQLQNLYYSAPIEETGGIMLVSDDDANIDSIIITEHGYVLKAKNDVKKYLEFNKIGEFSGK